MSIEVEIDDTIDDEVIDALNDACGPIDKDINLEETTSQGNFENLLTPPSIQFIYKYFILEIYFIF